MYSLDPWGEVRDDWRGAYGCAASLAAMGAKSVDLKEWMPDLSKLQPQSAEDNEKRIKAALIAAAGGNVVRK